MAEGVDHDDHWHWRAGPVEPGPAVVFDLDGVLSDAAGRQHYLEDDLPNWRAFFDACGDDPLIEEVATVLHLLADDLAVVLLTARPLRVRPQTLAWLERYQLRWDLLVMRPWGEYAQSPDFKELVVGELRSYGFVLRLAFEDDRRNVRMFHRASVPCLYVHSGYYD